MAIIHIGSVISTKALSSRPSARLLDPEVADAAPTLGDLELTFDLRDKLAMAPAFFDELIRIVAEKSDSPENGVPRIELINVPSRASSKFHAVCRSHGLSLKEAAPGHWIISRP